MSARTERREKIINAAIEAYGLYGSHFSTRDVAQIADCSQTLVYSYYRNKKGLVDDTFRYICTDIKLRIREIQFPSEINCDTVQDYFMKAWKKYFEYLSDDETRSKTNFYFYCLLNGYRYPDGYDTTQKVLIKLIGDKYDALIEACPNAITTASYLMAAGNGVAIGIVRGDFEGIDNYMDKIVQMVYSGIVSMKTKKE